MVLRKAYIHRLQALQDKKIIKVITGVRRCGKSTLLEQFQQELRKQGVRKGQILSIHLDDVKNSALLDFQSLHDYVLRHAAKRGVTYVFLDEIQLVPSFERTVNSLFLRDHLDLYITGSNGNMLSGELATLLSGRYVELHLLPLSFAEYKELRGLPAREAFRDFLIQGGLPYAAALADDMVRREYLEGVYNTVLLKDVVARNNIHDVSKLERVAQFLLTNVGSLVSSKKIADTLTSYGSKANAVTVESYIQAMQQAFLLYKAERYDVKGKQRLQSLAKYYTVDVGLRSLMVNTKPQDTGYLLENMVYLELCRRGYRVFVGALEAAEIDFVAIKDSQLEYYQVAQTVLDTTVLERELAPLAKQKDHYPKYLLTLDEMLPEANYNGIVRRNALAWLLDS